jgi:hypothetical protein
MTANHPPGSIPALLDDLARLQREHDRLEDQFTGLRGQTTDDTVMALALQLSAVRARLAAVHARLAGEYANIAALTVGQVGRELPRLTEAGQ